MRVWLALAGILLMGLGLRVLVLPVHGHGGDVLVIARWAENLADHGPWNFYQHDNAIYPALLPFLWLVGLAFDGEGLTLAVKGLSIPFDLLMGGVLFWVVRSRTDDARGLLAAGVYLLNPAAIIAGPLWGQVDAAGTLFYLAALVTLAGGRLAAAGGLSVLAGLAKPQFGLVSLPVAVVAVQRALRSRRPGPLLAAGAGAVVVAVAVGLFAGLSPVRWVDLLTGAANFQPESSLNAFNVWALVLGFEVPDAPYVGIGAALLAAGLIGSLLPLRRGHDLPTVLAVGLLLAFAFYFLPTRAHERYLFPALAVAAPFAAVNRSALAAYLALSLGFALSLLRALVLTTRFTMGTELDALLASQAMVWLIGAVLIGSALTLVRLILTGAGRSLAGDPSVSAAPG